MYKFLEKNSTVIIVLVAIFALIYAKQVRREIEHFAFVRRAWRGDSAGGVNLYVASDRSLKENIIDIPGALEIIGDLKPRRFNFKGGNVSKYQYGVIADEFKTVFPAKVSKFNEGESNESECISVEHLTGILTKAIQELTARIEALEGA